MRALRPVTWTNGAQSGGGSPRAARTPPASSGRNERIAARGMAEVAPLNAALRLAARPVPPVNRGRRRIVGARMIAVTWQGWGEDSSRCAYAALAGVTLTSPASVPERLVAGSTIERAD